MRIFYLLQLYTLPWLCVLLLGIGYGVGMLYFYGPSKYQEIFKIASLSASNTEKIDQEWYENTLNKLKPYAKALNLQLVGISGNIEKTAMIRE